MTKWINSGLFTFRRKTSPKHHDMVLIAEQTNYSALFRKNEIPWKLISKMGYSPSMLQNLAMNNGFDIKSIPYEKAKELYYEGVEFTDIFGKNKIKIGSQKDFDEMIKSKRFASIKIRGLTMTCYFYWNISTCIRLYPEYVNAENINLLLRYMSHYGEESTKK